MRFRHLLAGLAPVGAASALAIMPIGASASLTHAATATAAAGREMPAIGPRVPFRYGGKVGTGIGGGAVTPNSLSSTFPCLASNTCYTPQEEAAAYDVPHGLTGAGQSIVIVDAYGYPTLSADLAWEDKEFGLPSPDLHVAYPEGQPTSPFDPNNPVDVGWSGEIALDVESAHALAPGAKIYLILAKSDSDTDMENAVHYAVTQHLGSAMSLSWGEAESCESLQVASNENLYFREAEANGTSVFAAAGDLGAAMPTCAGTSDFKSVGLPASDPLVTGVGGTSLNATQPTGAYHSEKTWNNSSGASGGGYSTLFTRQSFQDQPGANHWRGVPDVSYSADPYKGLIVYWSGGVVAQEGSYIIVGGTSAGSPQWAAIVALADQAYRNKLGDMNNRLYAIAHRSASVYASAFHDIIGGNNTITAATLNGVVTTPVTVTGYSAVKGWDPVTGLGTPNVAHLFNYLH